MYDFQRLLRKTQTLVSPTTKPLRTNFKNCSHDYKQKFEWHFYENTRVSKIAPFWKSWPRFLKSCTPDLESRALQFEIFVRTYLKYLWNKCNAVHTIFLIGANQIEFSSNENIYINMAGKGFRTLTVVQNIFTTYWRLKF